MIKHIEVEIKLRFIHSSGGNALTYGDTRNFADIIIEFLSANSKIRAFSSLTEYLVGHSSPITVFEREFTRKGFLPVIRGSSFKGFLRYLFDHYIYSKFIINRLEHIVDRLDEIIGVNGFNKFYDVLKNRFDKKEDIPEKDIYREVAFYVSSMSPYSCLLLNEITPCSVPLNYANLDVLSSINNHIINILGGGNDLLDYGCIDLGYKYHCIPLRRCISCTLFGGPGYRSIVSFGNLEVNNEVGMKSHILTFNTVLSYAKRKVSTYSLEVFGLEQSVSFRGSILIDVNPLVVGNYFENTYLYVLLSHGKRVDKMNILEVFREFYETCGKRRSYDEECIDILANAYIEFFGKLLEYAKNNNIGIGRRSRAGLGVIIDYNITKVNE